MNRHITLNTLATAERPQSFPASQAINPPMFQSELHHHSTANAHPFTELTHLFVKPSPAILFNWFIIHLHAIIYTNNGFGPLAVSMIHQTRYRACGLLPNHGQSRTGHVRKKYVDTNSPKSATSTGKIFLRQLIKYKLSVYRSRQKPVD